MQEKATLNEYGVDFDGLKLSTPADVLAAVAELTRKLDVDSYLSDVTSFATELLPNPNFFLACRKSLVIFVLSILPPRWYRQQQPRRKSRLHF
jgi:hypothetical protein